MNARKLTKKQRPRRVSRSVSSSFSCATRFRMRGAKTSPNTSTPVKNTSSPPSDMPTAPRFIPFPLATPVTSAITPTQRMSSKIVVPKM